MKSTKRKQICGARGKKGDGSPFRGQPVTIESAQKQAIRNLGFRGEVILVLGKLGGGAGRDM